jgi:hypothetical protein
MNPDDDGAVLPLGGGVDIEQLPLLLRLSVEKITVDFRLPSEEWSRKGQEEDQREEAHGEFSEIGLASAYRDSSGKRS